MLQRLLFLLAPETAHRLVIRSFQQLPKLLPAMLGSPKPSANDSFLSQQLWGKTFPNPIGLAPGFDKNAEVFAPMLRLGFGFVEVGTLTPKPQLGNDKPRLFRLVEDRAVINRLGFNNQGQEAALQRLVKGRAKISGIVGVNIGKNKDSADAVADYVMGWQTMAGVADYITINISSPNTVGLRDLQHSKQLEGLLAALSQARLQTATNPPLLLKIAPDLETNQLQDVIQLCLQYQLDGLIVTNTTIKRPASLKSPHASQMGGLSGQPLFDLSTATLAAAYALTKGKIPLIGVGGIASAQQAYQKIKAGANLVQLYTGLVYGGFPLLHQIKRGLRHYLQQDGYRNVSEAVGTAVN